MNKEVAFAGNICFLYDSVGAYHEGLRRLLNNKNINSQLWSTLHRYPYCCYQIVVCLLQN